MHKIIEFWKLTTSWTSDVTVQVRCYDQINELVLKTLLCIWLEFSDAFITGDYAPSPSQNRRSLKKKKKKKCLLHHTNSNYLEFLEFPQKNINSRVLLLNWGCKLCSKLTTERPRKTLLSPLTSRFSTAKFVRRFATYFPKFWEYFFYKTHLEGCFCHIQESK